MVIKQSRKKKTTKKQVVIPKQQILDISDSFIEEEVHSVFNVLVPVLMDITDRYSNTFKIAYGSWKDGKDLDYNEIRKITKADKYTERIIKGLTKRIDDSFHKFKSNVYYDMPYFITNSVVQYLRDKKYTLNSAIVIVVLSKILNEFGFANIINVQYLYDNNGLKFSNGDTIKPAIVPDYYINLIITNRKISLIEMYLEANASLTSEDYEEFRRLVDNYMKHRNLHIYHDVNCGLNSLHLMLYNNKNFIPYFRDLLLYKRLKYNNCECGTFNEFNQLLQIADWDFAKTAFNFTDEIDDFIHTNKKYLNAKSVIHCNNEKWCNMEELISDIEYHVLKSIRVWSEQKK